MTSRTAGGLAMALAAVWLADVPASARQLSAEPPPARPILDAALALATTDQPPSVQPARRDSVLNGVLIGAGVGALLGLIPDYYDDCEECHDSLYWSIAVGAGIGLLVDLLRGGGGGAGAGAPGTPSKTVRVDVSVAPSRVGFSGRVGWR